MIFRTAKHFGKISSTFEASRRRLLRDTTSAPAPFVYPETFKPGVKELPHAVVYRPAVFDPPSHDGVTASVQLQHRTDLYRRPERVGRNPLARTRIERLRLGGMS